MYKNWLNFFYLFVCLFIHLSKVNVTALTKLIAIFHNNLFIYYYYLFIYYFFYTFFYFILDKLNPFGLNPEHNYVPLNTEWYMERLATLITTLNLNIKCCLL